MVNNDNQLFKWYNQGGAGDGADEETDKEKEKQADGKAAEQVVTSNKNISEDCAIPEEKGTSGQPSADDILKDYAPKEFNHNELVEQAQKYSKNEYKTSNDLRNVIANHLISFMIKTPPDPSPTPFPNIDTVGKVIQLNNSTFENSTFQKQLKESLPDKSLFNKYRFIYYVYTECAKRIMYKLIGKTGDEVKAIFDKNELFKKLFEEAIPLSEFEKIINAAKRQASIGDLLKETLKNYFSAFNSDAISTASGLAKLVKGIMPQRYHYYSIKNEDPDEIERFKDVIKAYERDMERDEGEFDTMVKNLVDVLQMSSLDENMFKSTIQRLNTLFNDFGYNIASRVKKGGFTITKKTKSGGTQDAETGNGCSKATKNILKEQTDCNVHNAIIRLFNYYDSLKNTITSLDKILDEINKTPEGINLLNRPNGTAANGTGDGQGANGTGDGQGKGEGKGTNGADADALKKMQELYDFLRNEIERVMNHAIQLKKVPLQQGDAFSTELYKSLDEVMTETMKAVTKAKKEESPFEPLFMQLYKDLEEIAEETFKAIPTAEKPAATGKPPPDTPNSDNLKIIQETLPKELQGVMDEAIKLAGQQQKGGFDLPVTREPVKLAVHTQLVKIIKDYLDKLVQLFTIFTSIKELPENYKASLQQQLEPVLENIIMSINNIISLLKHNPDEILLGNHLKMLIKNIEKELSTTQMGGAAAEKEVNNNPMRLTEDVIREDAKEIKELRKKVDTVRQNLKAVERNWKSYDEIVKLKSFAADVGVKVNKDLGSALEGIKKELDKSVINVADADDEKEIKSYDVNIENHNAFNTYLCKNTLGTVIQTKIDTESFITYNFTSTEGDNDSIKKRSNFRTNRNAFIKNFENLNRIYEGYDTSKEQISSIYQVLNKFLDTPAIYYKKFSSYLTISSSKDKKILDIKNDLANPNDNAFIKFNDNYPFLKFIWTKKAAEEAEAAEAKAAEADAKTAEARAADEAKESFLQTIHVIVDIEKVKKIMDPIIDTLSKQVGPTDAKGVGIYGKNEIVTINEYLTNYGKASIDDIDTKIKDSDNALKELIQNTVEYATKYAAVNPLVKQKILGFLQGSGKTTGTFTLEKSLRDISDLIKNDFDKMKTKISIEYKNLQKGGTVKDNLIENRKTITDLIQDGYKQLDLLDALMQDFSGSLTKSLDMPGYYATNVIELGGFSVFDMLYKKYIMSANDADKGPYVASFELGEGMKTNKLIPREILSLTKQDKLIFIGFTFFIRLGTLAIIDYLVNREKLKQLKYTLLVYIGIYIGFFWVFLLIINIDTYKLRIVFNYLNMHSNSSVAFTHPALVGLFGTIMYLVMKNMDAGSVSAASNEDRTRLKYRMQVITLIAWVFVSILTLFT